MTGTPDAQQAREAKNVEDQKKLEVIQAYKAVMATNEGRIVMRHIFEDVLREGAYIFSPRQQLTSELAIYIGALRDAANFLRSHLEYDFTDSVKPVVRRKPYSQRNRV